jgi:hypothetical protein
MSATASLGSFVVNLGRLAMIPRGEGRVFQVAGKSIEVFHTEDATILATDPAKGRKSSKTYPAMVNEDGDILVGIEKLLAAWSLSA